MNEKTRKLLVRMEEYEKQWDAKFAVDESTGLFLYEQILQIKPQLILELGTWRGASAIYMGAALQELGQGKIITVDRGNDRVEDAKKNFKEAGMGNIIDFRVQEIDAFIDHDDHVYDFIFMDAAKKEQKGWLEKLLIRHVHPGTMIVVDDVITMGERMQDLFTFVSSHPQLTSKREGIDDGLLIIEVLE